MLVVPFEDERERTPFAYLVDELRHLPHAELLEDETSVLGGTLLLNWQGILLHLVVLERLLPLPTR